MHHILTDQSVIVLDDDFVPKAMPSTHPMFDAVVKALGDGDDATVKQLMDLPSAIVDFMQGEIQISGRTLFHRGRVLTTGLTARILQFMEEGKPELAKPLINFLEKVLENPSYRSVQGLYEWCEKSGLPITPEGDILAWKIVRNDYKDCWSGTFDNSVGQVVEVARHDVDEDPDRTCSYGLHFCSTAYLPHFGTFSGGGANRVMVVKVHPKDVVAFPRDYNTSKGRACRYEVIGQVPPAKAKDFFPSVVSYADFNDNSDDDDGPLWGEPELDKVYRTRDGRRVEIISYDHDEDEYPFRGAILPSKLEEHDFGRRGSFNLYEPHPLDLVELIEDDETVTPEIGGRYGTRAGFIATIDAGDAIGFIGTLITDAGSSQHRWKWDGKAETGAADDLVERLPDEAPQESWISKLFGGRA